MDCPLYPPGTSPVICSLNPGRLALGVHITLEGAVLCQSEMQEEILLVCDGAAWHKSGTLVVPDNIHLIHIPPYTPEMNPIEQVWREIRTRGFRNEVFQTLEKVIDRLCCTIRSITPETIRSITGREWIL